MVIAVSSGALTADELAAAAAAAAEGSIPATLAFPPSDDIEATPADPGLVLPPAPFDEDDTILDADDVPLPVDAAVPDADTAPTTPFPTIEDGSVYFGRFATALPSPPTPTPAPPPIPTAATA